MSPQGHQSVPPRLKRGIEDWSTYRTSQEHLDEEDDLLPGGQQTQINCSEACDCCGGDAEEEGIGVRYVIFAIGCV